VVVTITLVHLHDVKKGGSLILVRDKQSDLFYVFSLGLWQGTRSYHVGTLFKGAGVIP